MYALATGSLCLIISLSGLWQGATSHAKDEAAIRDVVKEYLAARERRDAAALGALFTSDADQLVSSGEWRKGRDELVKGTLTSSQRAARHPHDRARDHPLSGSRRRDRRRALRDHWRSRRRPPDVVDVRHDARGRPLAHRRDSQHAARSPGSMINATHAMPALLAAAWSTGDAGRRRGTGLARVPGHRRAGARARPRRAARVERVAEHRVEDCRSRSRMVVARRLGRTRSG